MLIVGDLVTKLCLTLMTLWTLAHQGALSLGFSRQEYWSRLPFFLSRWSSGSRDRTQASCTAGRFFTKEATREVPEMLLRLAKDNADNLFSDSLFIQISLLEKLNHIPSSFFLSFRKLVIFPYITQDIFYYQHTSITTGTIISTYIDCPLLTKIFFFKIFIFNTVKSTNFFLPSSCEFFWAVNPSPNAYFFLYKCISMCFTNCCFAVCLNIWRGTHSL